MTREEAKQIIAAWLVSSKGEKGQCGYIEGWFYEKDAEAFYMAIEALQQEETLQNLTKPNKSVLISRQDAMNEIKEMQDYISYKIFCAENNPTEYAKDYIQNMEQQSIGIAHVEHRILELPSAQPEIITCKDCKHLQRWRSEESAKKFGQIHTCARNVFSCPKPEDFCSFAERRVKNDICRAKLGNG